MKRYIRPDHDVQDAIPNNPFREPDRLDAEGISIQTSSGMIQSGALGILKGEIVVKGDSLVGNLDMGQFY
jgi:hypothetical protein